MKFAANFTSLGLALIYDIGNQIKLLYFGLIAVFFSDLAQCGHMEYDGFHGTVCTHANLDTNGFFLFYVSSCIALRATM